MGESRRDPGCARSERREYLPRAKMRRKPYPDCVAKIRVFLSGKRGLSGGRGPVFDWRQSGRLRQRRTLRACAGPPAHLRIGSSESIHRKIGAQGPRLQHGSFEVAPLHRVGLGRVLGRHQIVGYRDDREENDDEQKQGDDLSCPMCGSGTPSRGNAKPQADEAHSHESAHEIENEFQARFLF